MRKKYAFTGEEKTLAGGVTLKRIRALINFGTVKAGDLGGWIENEKNLNHDSDAWVYGDAWVYEDAQACGNARVYGNAWVCGGNWEKSPCYIQGTRWAIYPSSEETVACGCQNHTWKEWHDHYEEISANNDGNDVLEEYIRYFNLLCEMYGHQDCKIEKGDAA